MTPRPAGWRRAKFSAIALYLACVATTCARSGETAQPHAGRRIVAIGGPVTEIVFALGGGARVVAVDTSSVYPPEVTALPQVGYQRTISAESVIAAAPDLVVASADAGPPAALDQLRGVGIQLAVVPNATTPEETVQRITAVGAALHEPAAAAALASRVRDEITAARRRCCAVTGQPAPRAVMIYARGAGTLLLAGAGTSAAAMLELAGAHNAVTGFTGFKPISAEALVAAAPEVIVIPARGLASIGGAAGLLALPGVADTPAGRNRQILAIDDLLLLGFGPRLGAAIDELSHGLHAGKS